jgi:protein-tyrosine-phosphatase
MKEKKFDLSHTTPKAIHQIPNLDHYQVIVILSKEARRALPERSSKTVYLDWLVDDPSATAGTDEQIHKSYEDTFLYIKSQICDLVEAIIGTETCTVNKDA